MWPFCQFLILKKNILTKFPIFVWPFTICLPDFVPTPGDSQKYRDEIEQGNRADCSIRLGRSRAIHLELPVGTGARGTTGDCTSGQHVLHVTVHQDNTSCMALMERGRSGAERTRHVSIGYFWLRERVEMKEATVVHKGTKEMYANVLTKALQGSQFTYERGCLTGWV